MKTRINIILSLTLITFFAISCGSSDDELSLEKRKRGGAIIETGELMAIKSQAFPLVRHGHWYRMKIIGLLEHGSIVEAGDSIIQLEPADVQKQIVDWERTLETQMASLRVLIVNQENNDKELESRLKNELASFDLKKISLEASRFEPERIQRIKQLEYKQAEIQLAKEKKKIELNKIINRNNFRIQEIRVEQIKNRIEDAYAILPKLTIRTPIPGVFQVEKARRSELLKIGDELWVGNNMASVPDLEWMRVDTHVNETDFLKVHVGQKVAVRLDALPSVVFDGVVMSMSKLCRLKDEDSKLKSKQKVFDIEVRMLESDERLKPGMTVSCEYLNN